MTYRVTELFPTVQGEGLNAGRKAVFVRFTGCNLWNGLLDGREKGRGACADWCDTYFAKGEAFTVGQIVDRVRAELEALRGDLVVLTGGEPLLQVDLELLDALSWCGADIAVETNGTIALPPAKLHVCTSPKLPRDGAPASLCLAPGEVDELKIVVAPGDGWTLERVLEAERAITSPRLKWCALQPQDPPQLYTALVKGAAPKLEDIADHFGARQRAGAHALELLRQLPPHWRLSAQGHKLYELP